MYFLLSVIECVRVVFPDTGNHISYQRYMVKKLLTSGYKVEVDLNINSAK